MKSNVKNGEQYERRSLQEAHTNKTTALTTSELWGLGSEWIKKPQVIQKKTKQKTSRAQTSVKIKAEVQLEGTWSERVAKPSGRGS